MQLKTLIVIVLMCIMSLFGEYGFSGQTKVFDLIAGGRAGWETFATPTNSSLKIQIERPVPIIRFIGNRLFVSIKNQANANVHILAMELFTAQGRRYFLSVPTALQACVNLPKVTASTILYAVVHMSDGTRMTAPILVGK